MKRAGSRQAAERRGRWGEFVAELLLRAKGYRILGRRVRTKAGEVDLIAQAPGGALCFIEVKSRPHEAQAVFSLGEKQKQRIARAASLYLAAHPRLGKTGTRFDIVTVAPRRLPRHLKDAFRPGF